MSYIRIKTDNYLAILTNRNKMIEVEADDKTEAYQKARRYFLNSFSEDDIKKNMVIIEIPSIIGVLE